MGLHKGMVAGSGDSWKPFWKLPPKETYISGKSGSLWHDAAAHVILVFNFQFSQLEKEVFNSMANCHLVIGCTCVLLLSLIC